MAKLHENDIKPILDLYEAKKSYTQVALKFNVSRITIRNIVKGITWKSR